MKSKARIGLIVIFTLMVSFTVMMVRAPPQNQTISIDRTHDDGFVTEVGIGMDTSLVHVLDPNMDIRAFLVFRDVEVDFWEPLTNATLRLHTSNTLNFEANSSVTIYGVSEANFNGFLGPSEVLSAPVTSASVSFNTSQFYGHSWFDINVTEIVEELIRHPRWDGAGTGGTGPTDHIGFVIYGAEGYETRYFYDFSVGNGLEAQLVIHWNHVPTPPTPFPDADFNETYRGYNIWSFNGSDFGWVNYTEYTLFNISGGEDFAIVNDNTITGYRINAGPTDDFRLQRATPAQTGSAYLSVNITEVMDMQNGAIQWVGHLFGHANANKNVYDLDNELNRAVLLTVSTPNDADDDVWRFCLETHDAGAWNPKYGMEHNATHRLRYYLNYTWDYPNKNASIRVHNASSFSDASLLEEINRSAYVHILGVYNHEFAFNTNSRPGDSDWWSFNTISYSGVSWIVTDENGTVIDSGLDDYEDALIVIENELGADPEDPDPPGQDWDTTGPFTRFRVRLYIWMIGLFMIFGPLMFFAYWRPGGYVLLIGLFIILVGFAFLVAAGLV